MSLICSQKSCTICGEEFDVIWKSDINDWVLDNALIVKVVEKKVADNCSMAEEKVDANGVEKGGHGKKNAGVAQKKIKDAQAKEEVNVLKKICMHPECYHVLAVQDELENNPNGGGKK